MDARQAFLLMHWSLHPELRERLLSGLTEEELRRRMGEGTNSIAWLIWHLARCEDVGVNRVVAQRPPLLTGGAWSRSLRVPRLDIATGMTEAEVAEFSETVDVADLCHYWRRVSQTTIDVVLGLRPDILDEVIDPDYLHQVIAADGMLGDNAGDVEPFWEGRTKGWFLIQLGLRHNYTHLCEAFQVRGQLLLSR
jgi:DinB superfamily